MSTMGPFYKGYQDGLANAHKRGSVLYEPYSTAWKQYKSGYKMGVKQRERTRIEEPNEA